jgi:hypothetical protein
LQESNLWNMLKIQLYMKDNNYFEDNSYDDIDWLNEANRPINKKIKYWQERYANASSWLGKWYCQLQIDRFKKKLYHYEN